jgi:hypothetical protein
MERGIIHQGKNYHGQVNILGQHCQLYWKMAKV